MPVPTAGKAAALALGILFALPQQSWAHGGGLDSAGCHHETATGGYHCHNDDEENDLKAAGAAVGVLLALWVIWSLSCDDDRQALSALSFSSKIGPSETGIVAEYDLDGLNRVGVGVQTDQVERAGTYSGIHWRLAF